MTIRQTSMIQTRRRSRRHTSRASKPSAGGVYVGVVKWLGLVENRLESGLRTWNHGADQLRTSFAQRADECDQEGYEVRPIPKCRARIARTDRVCDE